MKYVTGYPFHILLPAALTHELSVSKSAIAFGSNKTCGIWESVLKPKGKSTENIVGQSGSFQETVGLGGKGRLCSTTSHP